MKTILVLLAAPIILFTSCTTNKSFSREQLTSTIQPNDKVGIILFTIAQDNSMKGSTVIGRNSYYFTLPDTSSTTGSDKTKKKKKPEKILVMDTLTRMVENKYIAYMGTPLVPAPVEKKIPAVELDAGIPCLPRQTVSQAIKKTNLDKMITINVAWQKSGGSTFLGISMGKIKPKMYITTKVYDRSGKKIWSRSQYYDPGLKIKNRGVDFGMFSVGQKDGMTGNQLLEITEKAFQTLFTEDQSIASK